jgi:hypothetical protein
MLDSFKSSHECILLQYVHESAIKIMFPTVQIFVLLDHAVLQDDFHPVNYCQAGRPGLESRQGQETFSSP